MTQVDDVPERLPALRAIVESNSVMAGECSICHEVLVVKGIGIETSEELTYMMKQAFSEHVLKEHSTSTDS